MTGLMVRKAIVTGASSGIGAVYARKLAERGYDLITVARNAERLADNAHRICEQTGKTVEIMVADLSNFADLTRVSQRVTEEKAISFLVNNAGVSSRGGVLKNPPDIARHLIAVNITAPTILSIAAAAAFADRGGGTIVNISSTSALAPELFDGAYSGSKNYLINLTVSLAAKTKGTDVRFQAVLPGPTATEMLARARVPESVIPRSMIMHPEDLVDAAFVGLDRNEILTLPTLTDEGVWAEYEAARKALRPYLAGGQPAPRYRPPAAAPL